MYFGFNFYVFHSNNLIVTLIDVIYLKFDDSEGILEKKRKHKKFEPKEH